MSTATLEVRGAVADWWADVVGYNGEPRVFETMIDGPRGTSKTFSFCVAMRALVEMIPGIRILVVRATRRSMTDSWIATFDQVLPHDDEAREGPKPETRSRYYWPSFGSEIVLGGLDEPMKLYGTDWDLVVVEEATQPGITEDAWQQFRGCLRKWTGGMRWQALVGLCNPGGRTHWLLKRWKRGQVTRYQSKHIDNPKFSPDGETFSGIGRAFMDSLGELIGVYRDRLRDGVWSSAEGAVFPTWDPEIHCVDEPPERTKWYCGAVDWGTTAPGSFLVLAVGEKGTVTVVREIYQTGKLLEWWCERAVELHRSYDLASICCDPARNDAIEAFNTLLRARSLAPVARGAINKRSTTGQDLAGIDLVRWYLETGKLFVLKDSLRLIGARDQKQLDAKKPTSLVDEFPEYVYSAIEKNEPEKGTVDKTDAKCQDHALDALRYGISFVHSRDLSRAKPEPRLPVEAAEDLKLLRSLR